jgi:hypothetical protein
MISLSNAGLRRNADLAIRGQCLAAFEAAGRPPGAALFLRRRERGCELFLSPAMAELARPVARANGAVACPPPPRDGLAVLIATGDALGPLPL